MPDEDKKQVIARRKKTREKKKEGLARGAALAGTPELETKPTSPFLDDVTKDPWHGLTERQVTISRLKMRGLSQTAIASVLGVSQPIVSKELKKIKKVHQERGVTLDKNAMVGQTVSVYEEVEQKAWELFHTSPDDSSHKSQALSLVMQARDKQIKLMTDLGFIEKAAQKVDHSIQVKAPLLESWDKQGKQRLSENILVAQLNPLDEPEPPEDDDIQDAEIIEEDDGD